MIFARALVLLMMTLAPLSGQAEVPSTCQDWSQPTSFEDSAAEYMRLATTSSPDFGCQSRAAFFAAEDLFSSLKVDQYTTRLKKFDASFREQSASTPEASKAFDDFKILLQLRWLNESYDDLRSYHSSTVMKGVSGATAATLVVGGAALLLHNPALLNLRKTARPALIRMVKYLGFVIFAKTTATAAMSGTTERKVARISLKLRPPPLDLIGGYESLYWNYSDLHLMRDIAVALADSVSLGVVQATVSVLALRYLGAAATAGGFMSKSSIIGLAVGYPISKLAAHYTEKAITDQYHKKYGEETAAIVSQLQKTDLTDWQRYSLGADLTKSAVSWVSTQDLFLQNYIEESTTSFAHWQICTRLHQHELKSMIDQRQIGISHTPVVSSAATNQEIQKRFDTFFNSSEAQMRSRIKDAIESKKDRLSKVRANLVRFISILKSADKSYLNDYVVQQRALVDRVDRYLGGAPIIDDEINALREQSKSIAPDSPLWLDQEFVNGLEQYYGC